MRTKTELRIIMATAAFRFNHTDPGVRTLARFAYDMACWLLSRP